ncbi:hypothetical protein ACET3Z_005296 [Daucus carota]
MMPVVGAARVAEESSGSLAFGKNVGVNRVRHVDVDREGEVIHSHGGDPGSPSRKQHLLLSMDDFPPLPPPGLVVRDVPVNVPVVLDDLPEVVSPPLNIVPLASSDENVGFMAPNVVDDVQDQSSFDLVAQMPTVVLLGEFDEAASSSDSLAQVSQAVRGAPPVNARGAPVLDNARVACEAGPVSAREVSGPLSARGEREAEPVVDLQARSQAIKHQHTMIDVGTFLENHGLSMNDFVKFQSVKYARNMDDFGCVKTSSLESLRNNFEVQNGVLRICSGDAVPDDAPSVPQLSPCTTVLESAREAPQHCPDHSVPENAPVAPLMSSSDAVLGIARDAPLECPISAPIAPVEMDVDQPVLFEVVCALPASFTPPSCPQAMVSESAKNKRKKGKGKGQNGPFFTESPQVSPPLASPSKRGKNVDADGFTQIENKRSLRSRGKVTNSNASQ